MPARLNELKEKEDLTGAEHFRRREAFDEAVRLLTGPGPAPVVLLAGEPGSGRAECLAAVARKVGETGSQVAVFPLNLEGFENGSQGLVGFLSLWGQRRQAET